MPTITVHRSANGNSRFRKLIILLDGAPVARLGPGQSTEIATTAAVHTISAKIDWFTSADLTLNLSDGRAAEVTAEIPWWSFLKAYTGAKGALRIWTSSPPGR